MFKFFFFDTSSPTKRFIIKVVCSIKFKVNFDNAENVEINFLLWVDKLPIEKLTKVPHDYNNSNVRYDQESIEVLEVTKI